VPFLIVALCLLVGMWLGLRWSVGARWRPMRAIPLDFGVMLLGWGLVLSLTARPLVAALSISGLAIGLMVVDQVKRAVLREPVVFADRAELLELVRHPRLYLPFAGTGRVVCGAALIVGGFVGLLLLEPPLWPLTPLPPILGIVLVLAAFMLPGRTRLLPRLAQLYETMAPTRDPAGDAARFGLLGGFVVHATLARAERAGRQSGLAPQPRSRNRQAPSTERGTIVLVQSESFFDVTRLHPAFAGTVLPNYVACRDSAMLAGRLAVPCWGANTVRSEFAVLTGIDEARLGLDRFNPYAAFARTPLESLAWRAKAAGWRTVCVHPFDLSFYGRTKVLPHLGFDTLIGPAAFTQAARGGVYVADVALAERVAAELEQTSGGLLVFAITMEGHGPWDSGAERLALPPALADVAEGAALSRYLFRQRAADQALPILTQALQRRSGQPGAGRGVLAFYGDHQPSLPKAFSALGFDDLRTDYFIWRSDGLGAGERRDIEAVALGAAVATEAGLAE
jgi:phosphoglycerol transferase MdoB-like AlkP superfamily enzyme